MLIIFSADQTKQKDIFCTQCLFENIKTKAVQYCENCDEPEPLCNDCAKHNIRQKTSRNHELCNDIEIFQIHQKGLNAKKVVKQTFIMIFFLPIENNLL